MFISKTIFAASYPYEMSESWPIEALKSQAVAARGYVINQLRSSGTYDVGDTSSDQVYKGVRCFT